MKKRILLVMICLFLSLPVAVLGAGTESQESVPAAVREEADALISKFLSLAKDDENFHLPEGVKEENLKVSYIYNTNNIDSQKVMTTGDLSQSFQKSQVMELSDGDRLVVKVGVKQNENGLYGIEFYFVTSNSQKNLQEQVLLDGNIPTDGFYTGYGDFLIAYTPSGEKLLYPCSTQAEVIAETKNPISEDRLRYQIQRIMSYKETLPPSEPVTNGGFHVGADKVPGDYTPPAAIAPPVDCSYIPPPDRRIASSEQSSQPTSSSQTTSSAKDMDISRQEDHPLFYWIAGIGIVGIVGGSAVWILMIKKRNKKQ